MVLDAGIAETVARGETGRVLVHGSTVSLMVERWSSVGDLSWDGCRKRSDVGGL